MHTEAEIESFLKDAGWEDAVHVPVTGDFSTRSYMRLTREGAIPSSAILMCSNPDQKTDSFVDVAFLLRRMKLASPSLYASDVKHGFVLMEDFGNTTVGSLLDKGQDRDPFDGQAAQVLATLHKTFTQTMLGISKSPLYNAALLTGQTTLFLEQYFPCLFRRAPTARERSAFVEAWHGVLAPLDTALPRSLVLRDFMPDNMMALAAPVLGQEAGLLDFQDAGLGSIAYDIASWCEEVRRDGGLARLGPFVAQYHALNPVVDVEVLLRATRIYAAQRHMRILGILVKLQKTEMIPRVWRAVQTLMKDVALEPVRQWFLLCRPPT